MTAIEWSDGAPIYRQLKDRVVAMLLDGILKPGDALPSVRQVAAEYQLNPITVSRAYQELADEAIVEKRRGLGMYVTEGASEKLLDQRARALPARRVAAGAGTHPAPGPVARPPAAQHRTEARHERDVHHDQSGRQRPRPAQGLQEQGRAGRHRVRDPAGPHRRPDRPERRRQDHRAQGDARPDPVRRRAARARPRSAHRTRRTDERRVLHRRRRGAAALDPRARGDRVRRRRASALRPRALRTLPRQHPAQART